ncbi:MAG: hypothetical protein RLZZ528_321, partial [Pseudomonadota bacterium]
MGALMTLLPMILMALLAGVAVSLNRSV